MGAISIMKYAVHAVAPQELAISNHSLLTANNLRYFNPLSANLFCGKLQVATSQYHSIAKLIRTANNLPPPADLDITQKKKTKNQYLYIQKMQDNIKEIRIRGSCNNPDKAMFPAQM